MKLLAVQSVPNSVINQLKGAVISLHLAHAISRHCISNGHPINVDLHDQIVDPRHHGIGWNALTCPKLVATLFRLLLPVCTLFPIGVLDIVGS
jgi:hypothetical protein